MNTFLKRTISVLLIFFIGILSSIFIIHFIIKYKADFSMPKGEKYVVFGHSHPECAFNDNLIKNFSNLCFSGEAYFYTYQKIKEVLPENDINTVFIEYTNNSIVKEMDEWIWGYERMNYFFPWHSPFMNKDDMLFLYEKNQEDFPKVISTSTRNNLTRIVSFDFTIGQRYGSYTRLEGSKVAELIKERESNNKDSIKQQGISVVNLSYLEKIIDYCKLHNVNVYLIRSPQHKYFPRKNEKELLNLKNKKFETIEFLDFDKFPLKDNEFRDFGHLNYKGAEVFSLWFNELIIDGLLTKKDKTLFINREIEKARKQNH